MQRTCWLSRRPPKNNYVTKNYWLCTNSPFKTNNQRPSLTFPETLRRKHTIFAWSDAAADYSSRKFVRHLFKSNCYSIHCLLNSVVSVRGTSNPLPLQWILSSKIHRMWRWVGEQTFCRILLIHYTVLSTILSCILWYCHQVARFDPKRTCYLNII